MTEIEKLKKIALECPIEEKIEVSKALLAALLMASSNHSLNAQVIKQTSIISVD